MAGIHAPNYTQIPNIIFDYWMNVLTPGEFKVLLCICRKTFGWNKASDQISAKQIVEMTGLSKHGIKKTLEKLIEHGLVNKFKSKTDWGDDAPNEYSINVEAEKIPPPTQLSYPPVGNSVAHPVGNSVAPQKKDTTKETIQKKTSKDKKDAFANASALARFFYDEMKKRNPVVPIPKKWSEWNKPFSDLIKAGASEEKIKKMIIWSLDHEEFWKGKITKPKNLYNSFNTIEKQMLQPEKANDSLYADKIIKRYCDERIDIIKNENYIEIFDKKINSSKIIEFGKGFQSKVNDFMYKAFGIKCC